MFEQVNNQKRSKTAAFASNEPTESDCVAFRLVESPLASLLAYRDREQNRDRSQNDPSGRKTPTKTHCQASDERATCSQIPRQSTTTNRMLHSSVQSLRGSDLQGLRAQAPFGFE